MVFSRSSSPCPRSPVPACALQAAFRTTRRSPSRERDEASVPQPISLSLGEAPARGNPFAAPEASRGRSVLNLLRAVTSHSSRRPPSLVSLSSFMPIDGAPRPFPDAAIAPAAGDLARDASTSRGFYGPSAREAVLPQCSILGIRRDRLDTGWGVAPRELGDSESPSSSNPPSPTAPVGRPETPPRFPEAKRRRKED